MHEEDFNDVIKDFKEGDTIFELIDSLPGGMIEKINKEDEVTEFPRSTLNKKLRNIRKKKNKNAKKARRFNRKD